MSRIGSQPIAIPQGVEVTIKGNLVTVKGPKGALTQELGHGIVAELKEGVLHVVIAGNPQQLAAFQGLYRSLLANMVEGVTKGFSKELRLEGVGFRANVQGKDLVLQIGFSHPCIFAIPEGIEVKVDKNVQITISGMDKQKVGQFAASVREKRKPEPYKGKGIRYKDEYIRRKAGKSGAK